jgi:hypothetical protein
MEEKAGSGWAPGMNPITQKILGLLTGGAGSGKKKSGRTPMEPKRTPAHHLNRWRDEGRQRLMLEAYRLGVADSSRPVFGPRWRAQYRSWKALAVAVERARQARES